MTPKEEEWLARYCLQEARASIKRLYRALGFWGMLMICYLAVLLATPDEKFTLAQSGILMVIILNGGNIIRELVRNRRIVNGKRMPTDRTDI